VVLRLIFVGCSWGAPTPVATPKVSPNVFFGGEPDSNQWIRICGLKDVALGPSVETGASVPSYSGGFADYNVVAYLNLL
jgi:hypothetical protein